MNRAGSGVHVALERTDAVLRRAPADHHRWLSPSECTRVATLRVDARRQQYLAGHWLARELLARVGGGDPVQWPLLERRGLPPEAQAGLHLSLSHSGDWIAVAASDAPVGIDIEQRGVRDGLHRFEHLLLADGDVPGSLDDDALLLRWVVKEAWLKRDCGSALPERLAELSLRPIHDRRAAGQAHVTSASTPDLHLALSGSQPPLPDAPPLHWHIAHRT